MSGDTNQQERAGEYHPNSFDSKITEVLLEVRGLARSVDNLRGETNSGFEKLGAEAADARREIHELKRFRADLKKKVALVATGLATAVTGLAHAISAWLSGSGGTPPPTIPHH